MKESGSLVDLKALFSLSWIGGEGIALSEIKQTFRSVGDRDLA